VECGNERLASLAKPGKRRSRDGEKTFGDGIAETIGGAVSPILVKYRLKMILATLLVLLLVS
jgi:hypothetical protein